MTKNKQSSTLAQHSREVNSKEQKEKAANADYHLDHTLQEFESYFQKAGFTLSQCKKQKLVNLTKEEGFKSKIQKILAKYNPNNQKDQNLKLLGGGLCQSKSKNISIKELVCEDFKNLQQIDAKDAELEKGFKSNFDTLIQDNQHKNRVLTDTDHGEEIVHILERCLNRYKEFIPINNNAYRSYVLEVFDLILQYIINGAFIIYKEQQHSIGKKMSLFLEHMKENIKLHQCQDLEFLYSFLYDLNEQDFYTDHYNVEKLQVVVKFVSVMIKNGVSIRTPLSNDNSLLNSFQQSKELIEKIKAYAEDKEENKESVWHVVDRANEKIRSLTKDIMIRQLTGLWAQRIEKFGQTQGSQIEDELMFYIEKFIDFTEQQSSSYLILYILIQINYLLEKGGLSNLQSQESQQFIQKLNQNLLSNKLKVNQFVRILQQKSSKQSTADNFFQFFSFTVKDTTYRFLSNQILLKYFAVLSNQIDSSESEKEDIWIHLIYSYATEKNESVKVIFQSNQNFIDSLNNQIQQNPSYIAQKVVLYQQERKNEFKSNKISEQEFAEQEDSIKDESDFLEKISLKLIEKWELDAKQRLDKDISLKDDVLLEVQDLYIDQNLTYLSGNDIFYINPEEDEDKDLQLFKIQTNKNAIDLILESFLVPNDSQQSQCQTEQEQDLRKNCKILAILAEGGTGKSMLIKKIETVLMKEKNSTLQKLQKEINFIPFLIKCNNLDPQNPSIEDYLKSHNLNSQQIEQLKKLNKNKLILLDGYDEYTGDYFRVYSKLKLDQWKNTLVIISSRMEKLTESEARVYFSIDDENDKRDETSYSIVQLKEFQRKDIDEYCKRFFSKQRTNQQNELDQVQYQQDLQIMQECMNNKQLESLLFLPINLYLFSRMIITKDKQELRELINNISDQIQIQEIFFKEQFSREAKDFLNQIQASQSDKALTNEIITTYFVYFQQVSMQMFLNKGIQPNFLQLERDQIRFQLQENIVKRLDLDIQQKLKDKIMSYVNSKIITKVKDNGNKKKLKQKQIMEFKHKSLFEYFVARSMKFDFDVAGDNIINLDRTYLQKFNINKKPIMNPGNNQSEQQILLKLNKLLEEDINSKSFKENYDNEDIKKTNRYLIYIKRSSIQKMTDTSSIDVGASNLLSALFISKFSYPNFNLKNCSLSKAYIPFPKSATVNFDQCNLNNAYLSKINKSAYETSFTRNAMFDSFKKEFDTDEICSSNDIIFYQNLLITISKTGYINSFALSDNGYQLVLSKQITCSSLNTIIVMNDKFIVASNFSLFELNPATFEIEYSFKAVSQIDHISTFEDKIMLSLKNSLLFIGNIQSGFQNIQIRGQNPIFNNQYIITNDDESMFIYKTDENLTLLKQITCDQILLKKLSIQGNICVTITNKQLQIWDVDKEFELINTTQNQIGLISSAIFSQDGKSLITGSNDQTCRIWNIQKGFELLKSIQIEKGEIKTFAYSIDGKYLVILLQDNSCQILNAKEQSLIDKIQGHTSQINSVAFSSNGNYFATGSEDQTIKIWNVEKGYQLIKNIKSHKGSINSIAFSESGKYLASGSEDGICKIWSVEKGFELIDSIQAHQSKIFSLCFSKNGRYLVSGSEDQTFKIWNAEQSFQLIETIQGQEEIKAVAFSQDCKYLATGFEDGVCKIWDVEKNFKLLKEIECHSSILFTLIFSTDDKYLATGSWDSQCKIWNVQKDFELINTLQGHENSVFSIAFSSDGKYLSTGSADNTCKIWNIEKGFQLINTIQGHTAEIKSIAFSVDSRYLATGSSDFTFKVWNTEKGFEVINTIKGHGEEIRSVHFSADSKYLATGSWDQTCKIWNTHKGFQLVKTIKDHTNCIFQNAFSLDGKYLATGSGDQTCKIWDVENGFELLHTIQGHESDIKSIAFSADSKYLATGSEDQTCKIWNAAKGFEMITSLDGHTASIYSIAFSANGQYLSTGSEDQECRVWDILQGFKLVKIIQGHSSYIKSVSFSGDNKYLATASDDQTVIIWDVLNNFEKIKIIEAHINSVNSITFVKDNKYLITSSDDRSVKIWDVEKGFKLAYSFQSGNSWIFTISLSPDGKYLATGSQDQACRIWNAEKGFKLLNKLQGYSGIGFDYQLEKQINYQHLTAKHNLFDQLYQL